MSHVLLLNGPNLGILGRRQPEIYGTDTLDDIERAVAEELEPRGWKVLAVQHDCEGDMIRTVQDSYDTIGAIINPGALMIAGWGLRDALANFPRPWIEVWSEEMAAYLVELLNGDADRDALVRAAALREAEAAIRTTELPEDYIDLFDNGADWAADLVHNLAATAPTSQEK